MVTASLGGIMNGRRPHILALFVTAFLIWTASVAHGFTVTGRVEVRYNKGNGLNQYYVIATDGEYRVWAHILDPDQDRKELALEEAAAKNYIVIVTGELEVTVKEQTILIKQLLFKSK